MRKDQSTFRIVFTGVMAAVVFVVTIFKFPFLGANVHFGNAMCILGGLLFGPVAGGLSAGIGSALYDVFVGGYTLIDAVITFVSKLAMGLVAGLIAHSGRSKGDSTVKNIIGAVAGALTYVALYMLKTLIQQHYVLGLEWSATYAIAVTKLIPSLINAGVAMVVAPLLNAGIRPALVRGGLLNGKKD